MRIGSIILIGAIILFFTWKCGNNWFHHSIVGKGEIITHTFNIQEFRALDVSGSIRKVEFIQSDRKEIIFEGYENLVDLMDISVEDGELNIQFKNKIGNIRGTTPSLIVYGPVLEKIELSGATTFISENISNESELKIKSSGASEVNIKVQSPNVEISLTGAGKAKVSGMTRNLSTKISGAADIKAFELMSEYATVKITGAGNAEIYASKTLEVNATGASNVYYKGNPQVNSNTSGASSVKQRN